MIINKILLSTSHPYGSTMILLLFPFIHFLTKIISENIELGNSVNIRSYLRQDIPSPWIHFHDNNDNNNNNNNK